MRPSAPTRGRSGSGVARNAPSVEGDDPGERVFEHEAQDLLARSPAQRCRLFQS